MDQPEYGKNTSYLTDFIQISYYAKLINLDQIRELYLNDGLSAAQIARQLGVAKSSILARLHSLGIREGVTAGRSTNPGNFRSPVAPYGYEVRDGKLVASKAELRICRTVVDLIGQKGFSANAVAKELISVAVLIATLYGGSVLGSRILNSVREAALTKAATGLPSLSAMSRSLTSPKRKSPQAPQKTSSQITKSIQPRRSNE